MTGASSRTSAKRCCSSRSPVTTPYRGSSPVVNLAIRTSRPYRRAGTRLASTCGDDDAGGGPSRAPHAVRRAAPGPPARRPEAPGARLPIHLLLLLPRQAADLGAGLARERHGRAARTAAAAGARDPQPPRSDAVAPRPHRLLRAARVGDGAWDLRDPSRGPAAPGTERHR